MSEVETRHIYHLYNSHRLFCGAKYDRGETTIDLALATEALLNGDYSARWKPCPACIRAAVAALEGAGAKSGKGGK